MRDECHFTGVWVFIIVFLAIAVYGSLKPELRDAQRRIAVLEQEVQRLKQ